jgi:hypothetical protein
VVLSIEVTIMVVPVPAIIIGVVPLAVTTPLVPVLPVVSGFGVVVGIGIGVGTVVLGTTVVPVTTGLLMTGAAFRLRRRPKRPRRVEVVPVVVITVGVVLVTTVPVTGGVVAAGFGSSAEAVAANEQATAAANRNFFTMLPPETLKKARH